MNATPPVTRDIGVLRRSVLSWRAAGLRIGLVPTMGALHRGHQQLIRTARAECDCVVLSIFVNPKQFGPGEDFQKYPRQEAEDLMRAQEAGAAMVFMPDPSVMYPSGFATSIAVGGPSLGLESIRRPGHFDGVATVVAKLLMQTMPDVAFFGEKDYQQLLVVRRVVRDLDMQVEIAGLPTVRDPDGLALSSRNAYLTEVERAQAPTLARVLNDIASAIRAGVAPTKAIEAGILRLQEAGFDPIDYVALRDAQDLSPLTTLDRPARLLAAATLGRTRLLDNIAVDPDGPLPDVAS
jgi:pantoate--beta-alanine ligase